MEPSQRESGVAAASESPCSESSLARTVTKLRSLWPTNRPPDSGEIRVIPPLLPAEPPGHAPRNRKKWLTILLHALLIGAILWCAAFVETPQVPDGRSSHGPLIVGVDPGRAQRKADPGTFYRSGIPECAAVVRRAADVQPHGPAATWRLAIGLVGCDGVFPVDAARRVCLRAFPRGDAKSPPGCRHASRAADRRALHAAAVDRRLGRASRIRDGILVARAIHRFDRAAVFCARREQPA